jgi:hypothetical protein
MSKMKNTYRHNKYFALTGVFFLLFITLGGYAVTSRQSPPALPQMSLIPSPIVTQSADTQDESETVDFSSDPNALCHIKGVFPDPNCTPGSIDPRVTPAIPHMTKKTRKYFTKQTHTPYTIR